MNAKNDESDAIRRRMRELRFAGLKDVSQLHDQAERVTDWREHVRAQPVLSAIAASLVGFTVMRTLSGGGGSSQPVDYATPGPVARRKSASMGLLSIAGGMAASLARQWLTEYVKKQVGVNAHATHQSTNSEQRSHAAP
jgi:hypothetical protein